MIPVIHIIVYGHRLSATITLNYFISRSSVVDRIEPEVITLNGAFVSMYYNVFIMS